MNIVLDIVNWILANWLLPLLPTNLPGISFSEFLLLLENSKSFLIYVFSILNNFISISLLLGFFLLVISAEIILFGFKTINWLLNVVRGAGA